MEYIDHLVGICITEKRGNVRMDICWNQDWHMEKKTVRYRKEEAALCDAVLYGLLKKGIGDAAPDCVKGGIKPSPFLAEKEEMSRWLSGTYMMGKRIGPFRCFRGILAGRLGQRNRPVSALLYDMECGQIMIVSYGPILKTWYLFEGAVGVDAGQNEGYILSILGSGKVLQKIVVKSEINPKVL